MTSEPRLSPFIKSILNCFYCRPSLCCVFCLLYYLHVLMTKMKENELTGHQIKECSTLSKYCKIMS